MSRREQVRMTETEVDAFLHEGANTMAVATVGPGGRPHLVAMWYGFVDGAPAFWTYGSSQKVRNLEREPALTALVEDGASYDQLRGVELLAKGTVLRDSDVLLAVARSVYERYTGPWTDEVAPMLVAMAAKRVAVRLDVESVVSWDHRKLGGAY